LNALWQNGRQKCWYSDTKINIHTIFNLLCCSCSYLQTNRISVFVLFGVTACRKSDLSCSQITLLNKTLRLSLSLNRQFFDQNLRILTLWIGFENSVDINGWNVDTLWVQLPSLHDLLYLSDDAFGSSSHIRIKIPFRFLKLQISQFICLFSLNQSKISKKGLFKYVLFAIELS